MSDRLSDSEMIVERLIQRRQVLRSLDRDYDEKMSTRGKLTVVPFSDPLSRMITSYMDLGEALKESEIIQTQAEDDAARSEYIERLRKQELRLDKKRSYQERMREIQDLRREKLMLEAKKERERLKLEKALERLRLEAKKERKKLKLEKEKERERVKREQRLETQRLEREKKMEEERVKRAHFAQALPINVWTHFDVDIRHIDLTPWTIGQQTYQGVGPLSHWGGYVMYKQRRGLEALVAYWESWIIIVDRADRMKRRYRDNPSLVENWDGWLNDQREMLRGKFTEAARLVSAWQERQGEQS
jgi:hypothetical protein